MFVLPKNLCNVCSNQKLLVLQQAKQKQQQKHHQQQITVDAAVKNHFLLLPYKGEKEEHLIKSMKRIISKLLLPEIKT